MNSSGAGDLQHPAPDRLYTSCEAVKSGPGSPSGATLSLAPMRRALLDLSARQSGTLEEIIGRSLCRLWYRSVQRGFLTPFAADKLAIRACNVHPSHIWGPSWWDAA